MGSSKGQFSQDQLQYYFAEKLWEAFAVQKHFFFTFSHIIAVLLCIICLKFSISFTDNIVSFEQLGLDMHWFRMCSLNIS